MSDGMRVSSRPVPGSALRLSLLGIDLLPSTLGPPTADERNAALLRRARLAGVTTFRVPGGVGAPRAERLLATALPGPDADLVTIGVRSFSELVSEGARSESTRLAEDLEVRLRDSLSTSAARLGGTGYRVLEWDAGSEDEAPPESAAQVLERLRAEGRFDLVAHRSDGHTGSEAGLRTGDLSLLDLRALPTLRDAADRAPIGFVARDPFAEGRLDGSRFAMAGGVRGPDELPPTLRQLHRDFDPVLRLGFLTDSRERTLAQASLQFLFHWPWVASVLVPLPSPERLEEFLAASSRPPLTDEEVDRALATLGPASGVSRELI